jgi:hypothetical protein
MTARALILALLVLALAACGGAERSPRASAPGTVVELKGTDTAKQAFAADEGKVRVLLLLSPT